MPEQPIYSVSQKEWKEKMHEVKLRYIYLIEEVDKVYQSILRLFPGELRGLFEYASAREGRINEIRLRCEKPILIMEQGKEYFLSSKGFYTEHLREAFILTHVDLEKIVQHVCHYSLYAFEEEIRQGYITVSGGHRIGMVGQVVLESGNRIRTIKHIRGLNIRVSHQMKGVAQPVLPWLYQDGMIKNVLIISPPGCGKTTLLRDIIRNLSDGNMYGAGINVGVVDERSEIAGSFLGQPQNDVGIRTDVLDACPKALGMMMLLRAMSPRVIAIDELGSKEEMEAVRTIVSCGSKVIATMHGNDLQDIQLRSGMEQLLKEQCFDLLIFLGRERGEFLLKSIYERTKEGDYCAKNIGFFSDYDRV